MPKPSHRETLLTEGLRVVHEHGFAGSSVREIVHAAGVPLGSFTNHFSSKEAFGLEVLNRYFEGNCRLRAETLENETLPPLERLAAWVDTIAANQAKRPRRNGCLFGNFSAETDERTDTIRERLVAMYAAMHASVVRCLDAAIEAGDLPSTIDREDLSGFIVASLQGALLESRAAQSPAPLERFRRVLFSTILR